MPPDHNDNGGPVAVGTQRWYCDPVEHHFIVTDRSNHVLHTWPTPHADNCRVVGNDHEAVVTAQNQLGLLVVSATDGTVTEVDPPADQLTDLAFRYATLLFMSGERVVAAIPTESTNQPRLVVIDLSDGNVTALKGFASSPVRHLERSHPPDGYPVQRTARGRPSERRPDTHAGRSG